MNIFIDCEFNGFCGELISMALVAENGAEWYEVLPIQGPIDDWVKENVMPILNKKPIENLYKFQQSLQAFLNQYNNIHIVADWPEDIALFCKALITGPGKCMRTPPLTMQVIRIDITSDLPHNALEDARAIYKELTIK